jgi:hypothetical protein
MMRKTVPLTILMIILLACSISVFFIRVPSVKSQLGLLTGKVYDEGIDTNNDSLFDFLRLGVEINVPYTGNYSVYARGFYNDSGPPSDPTIVDPWDVSDVSLEAGLRVVNLYFRGSVIRASKTINASTVDSISVQPQLGGGEWWNQLRLSHSYSYNQFDLDASLIGNVTDHGVDTDNDSDYDQLVVSFGVNVTNPGDYGVNAWGLGQNLSWTRIDGYARAHLEAGLQTVNVTASGITLYLGGVNCSQVPMVLLMEYGTTPEGQSKEWDIGREFDLPLSREYLYTEFEVLAKLTGRVIDQGVDVDNGGLLDYLEVGVEVEVLEAGTYRVTVNGLGNETSSNWMTAEASGQLDKGLNTLNMIFSGRNINAIGVDLSMLIDTDLYYTPQGQEAVHLDHMHNTSLPKPYSHSEFDAPPPQPVTGPLTEDIDVYVNFTQSSAGIHCLLESQNSSLIHFPSEVNLNDQSLTNARFVYLAFTANQSQLTCAFQSIDNQTARNIADAMLPSMEDAFQTTFTWNSTNSFADFVEVSYNGDGKTNLTQYTQWLMPRIKAPDLDGFSLTFAPATRNLEASVTISATRDAENQWTYDISARSLRTIVTGSADHTIDILDLLNVGSIDPSPYAVTSGVYSSRITLEAESLSPVHCVAHQPLKEVNPPARGWFMDQYAPTAALNAVFSFGNDSSKVNTLTFTFTTAMLPEFPSNITALIFLTITLLTAVVYKRKR